MKLSLSIIAKDEVHEIERILKFYEQYFDSVDVAVDRKYEDFLSITPYHPKLKVYQYPWSEQEKTSGRLDFARKRNWLAEQADCDYYVRIDTDDDIINADRMRESAEIAMKDGISIVFCLYEYSHDADGNITSAHNRDTIIKKCSNLYWNKSIHENVLPRDTANYKILTDSNFRIKHRATEEEICESHYRNIHYLVAEYNENKGDTDPRTLAYLGRTFLGVNDIEKAIKFLVMHIQKSGWDEDRYISRCQLAECHVKRDEIEEAKLCCMEAMLECPTYPDAYLKLHEIYVEQERWKEAIHWGEEGLKRRPNASSMIPINPSAYTWMPALTLAYAYFMEAQYEKADRMFQVAKKAAPSFPVIKEHSKMFEDAVKHLHFAEHFVYLAQYIKSREPNKLKKLFECVPSDMDDNTYIHNARNKMLPPKKWDENSIVIYCGPVLDEWADPSVITGIGGSEEAVIYLSRELMKLGKKVTVYNGCGIMEGEYNGVKYVNYQRFNPKDTFDTLVSWRTSIFGFPIKARRKLVWLHDVMPTKGIPESHVKNVDKFIVLSKFHRTLLPAYVPDKKILISSNGINPEDFKDTGVVREPHRCIYASSYDRGLEHLLRMWPDVRKEVSDAELHIFYGWNNIDKLIKSGDFHLLDFKNKMLKLLDQPGVFEHGRVGHKKLIQEYQKSAIYAYPCSYEEISCISAMKAQACGCWPVTTDFAALSETVKFGYVVKGKGGTNNQSFKDEIVNALVDNPHRSNYEVPTWANVASEWSKLI